MSELLFGATANAAHATGRDSELAHRAKAHGANYSLRIVIEARAKGIPISLGFALVNQETDFKNVFGHDPTIYVGAGVVTETKWKAYKAIRGSRGQGGMQGAGPTQLTWWEYQDIADRRGGCWEPSHNISVGFELLSALIDRYGYSNGIGAFNGDGAAAKRYSAQVRALAALWHAHLS